MLSRREVRTRSVQDNPYQKQYLQPNTISIPKSSFPTNPNVFVRSNNANLETKLSHMLNYAKIEIAPEKMIFLFAWSGMDKRSTVFFRSDGFFRDYANCELTEDNCAVLFIPMDEKACHELFKGDYLRYIHTNQRFSLFKCLKLNNLPVEFVEWLQ